MVTRRQPRIGFIQMMTGSRTRAKILEYFAFNPGARPYLRELAWEIGVSAPPVHRILQNLVLAGALQRTRDGRTVRYALRPRLPGFQDFQRLVLQERVVAPLVAALPVEEVRLFGSFARGAAGPHSDLDLFVMAPMKGPQRLRSVRVRDALGDLPCSMDIVVATRGEFEGSKDRPATLAYEIQRTGQPLYLRDAGR